MECLVFLCVCCQQLKAKNSPVAAAEHGRLVGTFTLTINGIEKHIKTGSKVSGAPPEWAISISEGLNKPPVPFAHGTCSH